MSSLFNGGASTPANISELRKVLGPSISYKDKLKANPNDFNIRIQYAVALDNEGNPGEAEDLLREALQQGQKKPEIYHALGMLYLKNKLYSGAIEEFQNEIRLAPKSAQAYLNLAQVYVNVNQNKPAIEAFEKSKSLNPNNPDVYLGLALLNNTSERYQYSVQYLLEYIKRTNAPGPGYALLCRVYINMRLNDKAIEAGKQATTIMPNDAACWYNLGQAYAYHASNTYDKEAIHAFERAAELEPTWGGVHFELARMYERQKRYDEAITRYRDCVRLLPNNGKALYQLGRLLIQQGKAEEGQQIVTKSQALIRQNQLETQLTAKIAANPNEPRYVFELGLVYKEQKEYQKALNTFTFLLQMAPNYPKAKEILEDLRRTSALPH